MARIIGFAGVARAGKTTAADVALNHLYQSGKKGLWKASYAGPIRTALQNIGVHKDKHPDIYREVAQYLGAKMREYDAGWWRDIMEEFSTTRDSEDLIFIDDVRYRNEADQIKRLNGILVYINPGRRLHDEIVHNPLYEHESEDFCTHLFHNTHDIPNHFDYEIDADCDLDQYRTRIKQTVDEILKNERIANR